MGKMKSLMSEPDGVSVYKVSITDVAGVEQAFDDKVILSTIREVAYHLLYHPDSFLCFLWSCLAWNRLNSFHMTA